MKMMPLSSPYEHFCEKMLNQYEKIVELGLLRKGAHFTKDNIEYILDCKIENNMHFRKKFMKLQRFLEYKGFFSTTKKLPFGELKTVEDTKVAQKGIDNINKAARLNLRTHYVLIVNDTSSLNERDKKIYDNTLNKVANIAIHQQRVLLEQCGF